MDSTIEVTDLESYDKWNYKTHMISRKVFLLSSTELGVPDMESITAKEGLPLSCFDGKEYDRKVAGFQSSNIVKGENVYVIEEYNIQM